MLMMSSLLFFIRKAPFCMFLLFVVVLILIVIMCVLPPPTGHNVDHTDDHMVGIAPVLSLIAMALLAMTSAFSMSLPQRPIALKGFHRWSRLIQPPLLVCSCVHHSPPLRR